MMKKEAKIRREKGLDKNSYKFKENCFVCGRYGCTLLAGSQEKNPGKLQALQ
jgi:hypothetical protein